MPASGIIPFPEMAKAIGVCWPDPSDLVVYLVETSKGIGWSFRDPETSTVVVNLVKTPEGAWQIEVLPVMWQSFQPTAADLAAYAEDVSVTLRSYINNTGRFLHPSEILFTIRLIFEIWRNLYQFHEDINIHCSVKAEEA